MQRATCLSRRQDRQAEVGSGNSSGRKNLQWGVMASPLVLDKIVVVNPGPHRVLWRPIIVTTGEVVWAEGKHQAGYSSPMLVTLAGVQQILLFDGRGIAGCDPRQR